MDQLTLTAEEIRLRELTTVELAPERRLQLAEFVLGEIRQPPRRSRARMIGLVGAVIAALTLGGGVAYAWISSSTPADPYTGYCYPDQNLDRGDGWTGTEFRTATDVTIGSPGPVAIAANCAAAWRVGSVHAPGVVPDQGDSNPVPTLVVCVNDERQAVVFPGTDELCAKLGLANLA